MPSALTAAIAAPRAVVSVIVGLTVKEFKNLSRNDVDLI
jgi:hypothetical protein